MTVNQRRLGLAGCALLAAASTAQAQQAQPSSQPNDFAFNLGPLHLGGLAGSTTTQDIRWSGTGNLGGLGFSGSGKLRFNTGASVAGFASIPVNRYMSLVGQLAYASTTFDRFNGRFTLDGLGTSTQPLKVGGRIDTLTGFATALVTPIGRRTWTPYVGIGIGFNHAATSLNDIAGGGLSIPINKKTGETDLAMNALAGLDYSFDDHWAAGVVYQYIRVAPGHLGSGGSIQSQSGFVQVHFFGGIVVYNF